MVIRAGSPIAASRGEDNNIAPAIHLGGSNKIIYSAVHLSNYRVMIHGAGSLLE